MYDYFFYPFQILEIDFFLSHIAHPSPAQWVLIPCSVGTCSGYKQGSKHHMCKSPCLIDQNLLLPLLQNLLLQPQALNQ